MTTRLRTSRGDKVNDQEIQEAAASIAGSIITAVALSEGPVVWVTGNSYMPPLRSFPAAEKVWQDMGDTDVDMWEYLYDLIEARLTDAQVLLESPNYDNSLYAVDLTRWKYRDDDAAEYDNLNDEWERVR